MEVGRGIRLVAKSVDIFIVLLLSIFFYPLGILLGLTYISLADGLQNGRSVGKKLLGLAVISLEDGRPCSPGQSFVRNLPISIPLGLAVIPFIGWIFSLMLGAVSLGLEIYLILKLDSGNRLGDVMADTTVMASGGMSSAVEGSKWGEFDPTQAATTP